MRLNNLTGKVFGRLTVLYRDNRTLNKVTWVCLCACGNTKSLPSAYLVHGGTKSCGCLASELTILRNTTHSKSNTPEYLIWSTMKSRCSNENVSSYHRYGGRGIKVCERWLNSFENFYEDMGPRPTNEHSIERRNGNKGYAPDNCYWATQMEQAQNRCSVRRFDYEGKSLTLTEIAQITGKDRTTLNSRVAAGKSLEEALSKEKKPYLYNGKMMSLKEVADAMGVTYKTLHTRIRRGWTFEEATAKPIQEYPVVTKRVVESRIPSCWDLIKHRFNV